MIRVFDIVNGYPFFFRNSCQEICNVTRYEIRCNQEMMGFSNRMSQQL